MENTEEKKFIRKQKPEKAANMVETIFGCKWSITVYMLLKHGINRPGQMVKSVEGLSTKILNTCLKRNMEFGIIKKEIYNESPPRVEYFVTDFGKKFINILNHIEELQLLIESEHQ